MRARLLTLLIWMCRPAEAAEPCGTGPDALFDAVLAGDRRSVPELLCELAPVVRGPEAWDRAPVATELVEALRAALPPDPRRARWIPSLSIAGDVSPSWDAATRLDAGRAVGAGVRWSVALGLTFAARPALPVEGAIVSRGTARQWTNDVAQVAAAGGAAGAAQRVEGLSRWLGAHVAAALDDAKALQRALPPKDLRGRVLAVLNREEALARVVGWLEGGAR